MFLIIFKIFYLIELIKCFFISYFNRKLFILIVQLYINRGYFFIFAQKSHFFKQFQLKFHIFKGNFGTVAKESPLK